MAVMLAAAVALRQVGRDKHGVSDSRRVVGPCDRYVRAAARRYCVSYRSA